MVENQIRTFMPRFEVGIALPKVLKLLSDCGITKQELKDYPIEGYYYKSEPLKEYFTIIRNLQHNEGIFARLIDCPELFFLQKLTSSEIWGELKNNTTSQTMVWKQEIAGGLATFIPSKAPYNSNNPPLIRRYDILTLTMQDKSLFNLTSERPWTIDSVKAGLSKHFKKRPNLVELAYLTNDVECLVCGAETNALYRMLAMCSGMGSGETYYLWEVSKEMEELGRAIIDQYNYLIGSKMEVPTIFNHGQFKKTSERPRVALLGAILTTGENYFWTLSSIGSVSETYTTEFLTTETQLRKEHPDSYNFKL